MKVVINNNIFLVKWEYEKNTTMCSIHLGEDTLSTGIAVKAKPDQHCKNKARRISLTKALKNANFSKHERSIFWADYRVMTKTPRW